MLTINDNGVVSLRSPYSVPETIASLERAIQKAGLQILARIDHGAAAADVGIAMPPTQLLIFGSASAGTLLMLASPMAAIDLPLKGLAWQDDHGTVWLSYNNPLYIGKRHQIPTQLLRHIEGIKRICEEAVSGIEKNSILTSTTSPPVIPFKRSKKSVVTL
ncbi:hypothetical protein BH10ACI4_BH10ACI4_33250 [soil metagenome]